MLVRSTPSICSSSASDIPAKLGGGWGGGTVKGRKGKGGSMKPGDLGPAPAAAAAAPAPAAAVPAAAADGEDAAAAPSCGC